MDKPAAIYKYERFSAQSPRNLKVQSIYFGSPIDFNDPYDCALKAGVATPTDDELAQLKAEYTVRPDIPEVIQKKFAETGSEILREIVMRSARVVLEKHVEEFLTTKGKQRGLVISPNATMIF